jgi:hypothetical protein
LETDKEEPRLLGASALLGVQNMHNRRLMVAILLIGVAVLSALLGFAVGRSDGPPGDRTHVITVGDEVVMRGSSAEASYSFCVDGFPQYTDIRQGAVAIGVV